MALAAFFVLGALRAGPLGCRSGGMETREWTDLQFWVTRPMSGPSRMNCTVVAMREIEGVAVRLGVRNVWCCPLEGSPDAMTAAEWDRELARARGRYVRWARSKRSA
jgi:hypothetical protein